MRKISPEEQLESLYADILRCVGADEEDPELDVKNTPGRVRRMLIDELLSSYRPGALEDLKKGFTTFPAPKGRHSALVTETGIFFASLCSHHMLPFFGKAHVGYLPNKKIVGLSKIPRTVDFFSRKLQLQERLVEDIADFLVEMLDPRAVLVYMEARHCCMELRGVRAVGVVTKTIALRRLALEDDGLRSEFYRAISLGFQPS